VGRENESLSAGSGVVFGVLVNVPDPGRAGATFVGETLAEDHVVGIDGRPGGLNREVA
jgi:hypothetical protein